MRKVYGRVEPNVRINRDLEFLGGLAPTREFHYKSCPNCGGSAKKLKLLPWPHIIHCNVCPEGKRAIEQERARKERAPFVPRSVKNR